MKMVKCLQQKRQNKDILSLKINETKHQGVENKVFNTTETPLCQIQDLNI